MKTWSITEARANISRVFNEALKHGPQRIERRDSEPVVLVAESDWNRMVSQYPTLAEWILSSPLEPGDLPERRPARAIAKDVF
jgi:antitoxin Phd